MEQADRGRGGPFQKPIENNTLSRFCRLLKNEADKVLNGQASFALTTDMLSRLDHDCCRHSLRLNQVDSSGNEAGGWLSRSQSFGFCRKKDENNSREEWNNNIQFVKDFMLSTPNLKIIHNHGTISYPISLHHFGNVTTLELRKIPIHLVEGLQALRGRLKSFIANRCLSKPKELLECCGGDRGAALSWQQLKYISLVFNDISHLDDSLRLVPYVEYFDLSHNQIETCDNTLQYLSDVLSINLAYNVLVSVPALSVNTRTSLTTLNLRGNHLDSIEGIEEVNMLQNLDLGENYIVKHTVLSPLKCLLCLRQLQLDGNPLYYHKKHRPNTISCLAVRALTTQFLLDLKNLSRSEILAYRPKRPLQQRSFQARYSPPALRNLSINADATMSSSSGTGTFDQSSVAINSSTTLKKGKRKKVKARDTEIKDTSLDYSSGLDYTPAGSPTMKYLEEQMDAKRQEALKTKKEIELLKKHYGPNYLQAIEDRKLFSQTPSETIDSAAPDKIRSTSKSTKNKFTQKKSSKNLVKIGSDGMESSLLVSENAVTKNSYDSVDSKMFKEGVKEEELKDPQNLHTEDNNATVIASGCKPTSNTDVALSKEDTSITDIQISNPIMAAIERIASGQSSDESVTERSASKGTARFDLFSSGTDGSQVDGVHEDKRENWDKLQGLEFVQDVNTTDKSRVSHPSCEKPFSPSTSKILLIAQSQDQADTRQSLVGANESTDALSLLPASSSVPELSVSEKCLSMLGPRSSADTSQSSSANLSLNQSTSEVDTSNDNSMQLSEDEVESEPVFVTLPEEKNKMIIVTFTDLFLVEKNVRDKVTEKLDLRSLSSLETKWLRKKRSSDDIQNYTADALVDDSRKEEMSLRLKFNYIRKDRQKRYYLVDAHDGKNMVSHLQPFLDFKAEKAKAKNFVVMQCLKCNKTFDKKDLAKKSKQLPRCGSSKDFHTMKLLSDKPTLICPACGSSIIIEIENDAGKDMEISSPSTPLSSFDSSSDLLESIQKPQKPSPLLRNRSFDNQSLQAKIAAKLVGRKSSVSSLDSERSHQRTGSGSGSIKSFGMYGSSPQTETRERSNAFNAMSPRSSSTHIPQSSFLVSMEKTPMESEELVCVDDHFTAEDMKDLTMSQELALITTKFRGDSSGREQATQRAIQLDRGKDQMEDSGFESGVYLSGSANFGPHYLKVSQADEAGDTSEVQRKSEDAAWANTCRGRVMDIPEGCKHLASMEGRVYSLVREGELLERQEWAKNERIGRSAPEAVQRRRNSVTISDLKKLISSNKDFIESDMEGEAVSATLDSGSSSSIAILANNENKDNSSKIVQANSLQSTPVRFMLGSAEKSMDQHILEECSPDLTRVSSPLNSNICSSMVSSIYETSVASSEQEEANAGFNKPVVLGSSDSAKSNMMDDELPSIYDQPSNLRFGSRKSNRNKIKSKKSSSSNALISETLYHKEGESFPINCGAEVNAIHTDSNSMQQRGSLSLSEDIEEGAISLATSPGNGNNDSEDLDFDNEFMDEENMYRFDHLNHRLTLYLMMSLFSNDEEFQCKIQGEITQYIVDETYSGILIMSTQRFYILKITSEDHSKEPQEWLSCVEVQPILELRYIDIGLGSQSLRIEFVTDCSSYTLVTRDKEKTTQFVEILHDKLTHYAISAGITSNVVVNEDADQTTIYSLDAQVVSKGKSEQKLLLYCLGFIERGNRKLFPVSFVISTDSICLVKTNHQWPQPRLQGPITVETVGKQFTVLERQKINNVASVELCKESLKRIKLELFNETEGISTKWHITMTNRQNAINLIHALSNPWAKEFGVELEVTYSELNF